MQSRASNVDAYLAELPPERKAALTRLRRLIRQIMPTAVEGMRYGMPCYEIGDILCGFAAQKQYLALYVVDTRLVETYRKKLVKLSIGKCCIRFRHPENLPWDVVASLLSETAARRIAGVTKAACDDAG